MPQALPQAIAITLAGLSRPRAAASLDRVVPAASTQQALPDLPGCAADQGLGALGFTTVGYSTRTLDAKPKHRSAVPPPRSLTTMSTPPRPTLPPG